VRKGSVSKNKGDTAVLQSDRTIEFMFALLFVVLSFSYGNDMQLHWERMRGACAYKCMYIYRHMRVVLSITLAVYCYYYYYLTCFLQPSAFCIGIAGDPCIVSDIFALRHPTHKFPLSTFVVLTQSAIQL